MMNNTDELRDYVERLMRASEEGAFLIVSVAGSEDFVQMIAGGEDVQIDFPLVTDRQRGFESKIRTTAASEGLAVEENEGDDSARFLDMYVEKDAGRVARVCRSFLRDVFGAGENARLEFESDGLG
jgi:hypothetical protein